MLETEKLYYLQPQVRSRIAEYCGATGDDPATGTAEFLVGNGHTIYGFGVPSPENTGTCSRLDDFLGLGKDIFRSLWDKRSTLAVLDLDYANADFVDEAFYHPYRCFAKLEPVHQAVKDELRHWGIRHICTMTGQGYHFTWRLSDAAPAADKLKSLMQLPPTLESKYRHDHPLTPHLVPLNKGLAHAGMGLLLEHLVHRIIRRSAETSAMPVVVTDLVVGSRDNGREVASLDLSAHGDPLFMRYIRCAFSVYHKAHKPELQLAFVPRKDEPWYKLMDIRSQPMAVADVARDRDASIPESSTGTARLLEDYLASRLRAFHKYYEAGFQDPPEQWPAGYDRLDLARLPPCCALPLANPNYALLKPTNIQNVSRVLTSLGWHPRSVAGLIRSKYERDYGWGEGWLYYDAAARCDFYVRLFCGLIAGGVDDLRDMNCVSHQERGFCPQPWCGHNLGDYRMKLDKQPWV